MLQLETRTGPRLTRTLVEDLCSVLTSSPTSRSLIDALDEVTRGEWQDREFTHVYVVLQAQLERDGFSSDLVEFDLNKDTQWTDRAHIVAGALHSIS